MAEIYFHIEDVELNLDEEKYSNWLEKIATNHDCEIVNINYIFCSDEYLLKINQEYLNHDYYTDIITFPYQEGKMIESDIYISLDRVKDNAQDNNVASEIELRRVVAHGLLHLIGYNDKTPELQSEMTKAEDESIALFNSNS